MKFKKKIYLYFLVPDKNSVVSQSTPHLVSVSPSPLEGHKGITSHSSSRSIQTSSKIPLKGSKIPKPTSKKSSNNLKNL